MPWTCSIVANHQRARKPGDMWRSKHQHNNGHWLVLLPNGLVHDINGDSSDGTPWQVSGEAPNFTVSPSINCQIVGGDYGDAKGWHGWLQNGVLTDDCEGRTYSTLQGGDNQNG